MAQQAPVGSPNTGVTLVVLAKPTGSQKKKSKVINEFEKGTSRAWDRLKGGVGAGR